MLPELLTKKLHIYVLILPSTIKMRQNLIFNVKVIEDSNRGFGLFRKGILKSKRPTGMSLCCLFTSATGYQAPPPIFYWREKSARGPFFSFQNQNAGMVFFFWNFLSPVAGANEMLPYGVPFDSLSFLYLPSGHFFDFKITLLPWPFLTPQFFIPRCGS